MSEPLRPSENTRLLANHSLNGSGLTWTIPQYGALDESDGGELTDGGAWTDMEAFSILRNHQLQAERFDDRLTVSKVMSPEPEEEPSSVDATLERPWGTWISICMLGFSTEFAWAVGEALMMPHMIDRLHISVTVASLIWLISPIISVFLQPAIGNLMDRHVSNGFGRRRPFIVAIGFAAFTGIATLMLGEQLALTLGLSKFTIVIIILASFGVADLGHDCLLIPGRTLIGDIAEASGSEEIYQTGHALFSGFQSSGRLCAEICGMLPLMGLGIYAPNDTFHTLFTLSIVTIILCCAIACLGSKSCDPWTCFPFSSTNSKADAPLKTLSPLGDKERTLLSPNGHGPQYAMKRNWSAGDLPLSALQNRSFGPSRRKVQTMPFMECRQRRRRWEIPLPMYSTGTSPSPEEEVEEQGTSALVALYEESGLVLVILMLGVIGWVALNAMSFFWSLWLGIDTLIPGTQLRLSFVSLAGQASAMTLTAACLPFLNNVLGELTVFLLGHLAMVVCMALTKIWVGPLAVLVLGCGLGMTMVIHTNNALTICEHMVDNARLRATVMSVVNCTMPMGQIITAVTSGPIISYLNGDVAAYFFWIASVHALVLAGSATLLLIDRLAESE